ncbi:MAG TPA: XkdX family protein [Candidatus Limiplasma sp.]|jgi:hypothetical protein|nr:XkdX family protein [Candidatus Limiplasma sp.]
MSPKYQLVAYYYEMRAWDLTRVRAAVVKGWITEAEYQQITGEVYE